MNKPKRTYRAVGIERLNQILQLLLLKPRYMVELCEQLDCGDRAVREYVNHLLREGKVLYTAPLTGKQGSSPRIYTLAPGAMLYPAMVLKHPRRPRGRPKLKTCPKPKVKEVQPPRGKAVQATVKIAKAEQIGIARDPFQALFFGQPQHVSA